MSGETMVIRDVRLCTDEDGNEAIYVDGELKFADFTVYQVDIARECGDVPCTVRHCHVDLGDSQEWPQAFSHLALSPVEEAQ